MGFRGRFQRLLVALPLACAGSAALFAQQQPTFRSGTEIVSLFVTVNDAQKRLVPDLEQGDFEVLDNDKPQPLVSFENDVQPITVVVMLDTSGSMTNSIDRLKDAAAQFFIRLLPADKARVGAFNDKIQISARFTNNRDDLISEARNVDYGNGTRLWDAIDFSLDELKGIDGRRVVLVFTDGDDMYSKTAKLSSVVERARNEEVMIYAIGFESTYAIDGRMIRTKPDSGLRKIADETGGGYFELTKASDLGPTFTRVAQELHSQYVMGFAPTQLDGKVHKLTVRVKKTGMTARARRSYLAAPDKFTIAGKP
jgi:Ca-activated chloride channel family protein